MSSSRAEEQVRADIVEAGRRLYARAYVASNDGNISVRLDGERLVTTPKSVSKGFMTADMMVVVDYNGQKIAGEREPSSELPMHLEIYRHRPDVNAVVHAHPPLATGFAVAGIPLTRAVLAEVITTLGSIPIAEYATPSTAELPAAVRKYIKAHDGLLLANHGAVTCGRDVMAAYYKM
jgi:L-fuculose-phosphate aldolase